MSESGMIYALSEHEFKFDTDWKIITYDIYYKYLDENLEQSGKKNQLSYIIQYLKENPHRCEFKWTCEIGTMQFLLGIFPQEKTIRIASKQLSYELNLVNFNENYTDDNFVKMKSHAMKIAEIPLMNSPTIIEFNSSKNQLPLFNEDKFLEIHSYGTELSQDLIFEIGKYKQSFFEKFSDFGLDLTANFMLIRIHLLKFLAILPNLSHDLEGLEVKRIFLETLRRLINDSELATIKMLTGQKKALPFFYVLACKTLMVIAKPVPAKILAKILKESVALMARRFIAGENISKAKNCINDLLATDRDATIDQLGELVVSNFEADEYTDKVLEIIHGLAQNNSKGERNSAGILRAHVSIKVSALCNDFKPEDFDYTYSNVEPRLHKILLTAKEQDVFINIDAEHFHFRDIIFDIYAKTLLIQKIYMIMLKLE